LRYFLLSLPLPSLSLSRYTRNSECGALIPICNLNKEEDK
jgi:hypothetical protein